MKQKAKEPTNRVDISKMSIEELKIMVYDKSQQLQQLDNQLRNSSIVQQMVLLRQDIINLNQMIEKNVQAGNTITKRS